MELRTNTGFSGINYLQCFVQSYSFVNSKHKQTNDLFKYVILKDEFSGCDEVSVYFESDISQHFLVSGDIPNSKSKDRFSKKGRYVATRNLILVCNNVARVR